MSATYEPPYEEHEQALEYQPNGTLAPAQGIVLITDAAVLKPPQTASNLSPVAIYDLLDLGNMSYLRRGHFSEWYVLSREPTNAIHQALDGIWAAYAEHTNRKFPYNLTVRYHLNQHNPISQWSYGLPVAPQTGVVQVFGAEYWATIDRNVPESKKLKYFLRYELEMDYMPESVADVSELESALHAGMVSDKGLFEMLPLVLVQPTDESPGYRVQRFEIHESD